LKIGIPRALVYYYYIPHWKTLFEELGFEVVISDETNKNMLDEGIKISVQEICVPIKIFNSHVLNLINKGVDYIFVPRMVSIKNKETFCPKFLGLPDIVKRVFKDIDVKFLYPKIECNKEDISVFNNYEAMAKELNISKRDMKRALRKASEKWHEFRKQSYSGKTIDEIIDTKKVSKKPQDHSNITVNIGLLGYVYNIYDNFVNMNAIEKFKSMGINIRTFEMLEEKDIEVQLKTLKKRLFWTFSNKLLGAGFHFIKNKEIDGVIHITAFGCGPDSLIGKMMELESSTENKPFLTIRVDEHSGENHLVTRIEAFSEMIRRKKVKLSNEVRAI
jgi:predicted nucleotide-binding protein (sugar kinase/HSP70/actin superfamily)